MVSGLGVMLPVFRRSGHVRAAVEEIVHGPHGGIGTAVDERPPGGKSKRNRIGRVLDSGSEGQKRIDIPIDQWQRGDLVGSDGLTNCSIRRIDQRGCPFHLYCAGCLADLEPRIDAGELTDGQSDSPADEGPESRARNP